MAAAQKYPRMRLQFVKPAFNSDNGASRANGGGSSIGCGVESTQNCGISCTQLHANMVAGAGDGPPRLVQRVPVGGQASLRAQEHTTMLQASLGGPLVASPWRRHDPRICFQ